MHLFSSVVMISKWRQCRHFRSVRWFLCFSFVAFFFHSPFCIHLYVYYFLLINISIYVRAAVTNVSCHWFLSNEDRHCPSRLVLVSPFLLNDCFRELIILRLCWYRLKCQNSFPFIFCWFKEYIFFKPDLFQAGSRISELRITEWKATIIFRHRCSTVAPTFLFLSFLLLFIFFSYCFFFRPKRRYTCWLEIPGPTGCHRCDQRAGAVVRVAAFPTVGYDVSVGVSSKRRSTLTDVLVRQRSSRTTTTFPDRIPRLSLSSLCSRFDPSLVPPTNPRVRPPFSSCDSFHRTRTTR